MENKFIRADDVARELDVSKPYAYKLIRQLNVATYVSVRKRTERTLNERYSNFELSSRRKIETPIFYENLKRELR